MFKCIASIALHVFKFKLKGTYYVNYYIGQDAL